MDRRHFLKTFTAGAAGAVLLPHRLEAAAGPRLVILHTNDTHSRIDPFPLDGGRNQGLGGVARRAALVERIRRQHPHVLLLDSGDFFQGTPYYNFFGGEIELKAMSAMGYDATTLGNHEFDNGVAALAEKMPLASFPFVSSNYEVAGTPLAPFVKPYVTRTLGPVKVGIFGLGIAFEGLVLPQQHEGVRYQDPVAVGRAMVDALRREGCHLIVCLSHLGYAYRNGQVSDRVLAQEVPGIDLILGGHTHTFLDAPDVHRHADGYTVIHQVGFAGIRLGRIDIAFGTGGELQAWHGSTYEIDDHWDLA